ncbi:unnamed protein product, partial [Prorocentrum cordatum]
QRRVKAMSEMKIEMGADAKLHLADALSACTDAVLSAVCQKYDQMFTDKATIIHEMRDQISTNVPAMH